MLLGFGVVAAHDSSTSPISVNGGGGRDKGVLLRPCPSFETEAVPFLGTGHQHCPV